MEGSNFYRAGLALGHMLLRPTDMGRWLDDNLWRKKTAIERGLPWMSWKAIEFLDGFVKPGMRVFEWGGGGSTVFFLERGCHVTTVESSGEWKKAIERRAENISTQHSLERSSLEIRLVPAETGDRRTIEEYVRSVHGGAPWDIVVVDGLEEEYLSRVACIEKIPSCIAPGGIAVLDDAYRAAYASVPAALFGWRRLVCRGLGSARMGVTQTDIYFAPLPH